MNLKNILVFTAHADDEILSMGGTIAKLSRRGCRVNLVIFTSGDTGYSDSKLKDKIVAMREKESEASKKILGIKEKINLGVPCQGVVNCRELYQKCVGLIRKYKPDAVFAQYYGDKHRDHRAISEIVEEAWWKATENVLADLGKPWHAPHLFFFEGTDLFPRPSLVIDITETYNRKVAAMKAQESQLKVLPGIFNLIEGMALARGYLVNVKYGEAFLESNFMPGIYR